MHAEPAKAPQVDSGGYNFRQKRDASAGKTKLERLTIEPSDNGGHTVKEHHVYAKPPRGAMSTYIEPTTATFGKDEHHKMLAHVTKCLGVGSAAAKEGSAAEEKGESKAEEASESEAEE